MNKQIIKKKSSAIRAFCHRYHVRMLILFGSYASGTDHAHSDLDLAIQPDFGMQLSKLHLIQDLESIFEHRQIDLVVITKNTDPLLLFEIYSNGLPLFESAEGLFDAGRLNAWHLYLDTMPLRRLEKTYNEERIKALRHVTSSNR